MKVWDIPFNLSASRRFWIVKMKNKCIIRRTMFTFEANILQFYFFLFVSIKKFYAVAVSYVLEKLLIN